MARLYKALWVEVGFRATHDVAWRSEVIRLEKHDQSEVRGGYEERKLLTTSWHNGETMIRKSKSRSKLKCLWMWMSRCGKTRNQLRSDQSQSYNNKVHHRKWTISSNSLCKMMSSDNQIPGLSWMMANHCEVIHVVACISAVHTGTRVQAVAGLSSICRAAPLQYSEVHCRDQVV